MTRERGAAARLAWDLGYIVAGAAIATAIAWPVYATGRMLVVAAVATALGIGIVLLAQRMTWAGWIVAVATVGAYLVAVVPLAIPSALASPGRILVGLGDGVLGIAIGWKQILTLSLPLGEYQAVLVPFLVVMLVGAVAATLVAVRGGRFSTAAVPLVILMSVFGLVFGSTDTGAPLQLGPLAVPAPREVLLATLLVVLSLAWLVGRARMARSAALRTARASTGGIRQGARSGWVAARRQLLGLVLVAAAVAGGLSLAPAASGWAPREALRDAVDPLLIVQAQPSPLAGYRSWFEADRFDQQLFTVSGDTAGIDRVRIATLGRYDGEVFRPGSETDDQRFTRLPSSSTPGAAEVTVTIGAGYSGIWVPVPGVIASSPRFGGPRADELTDSFYVSRADASAVAVAENAGGGHGLAAGDSYTIEVQPAAASDRFATDTGGRPLVSDADYEAMADWVEAQEVPRSGEGLTELVSRLRDRGYLSHSLMDTETATPWISALQQNSDYVFQSSYAGHSVSRVETLFSDLADQQRIVGPEAADEVLVSAVGDDEQFAAAAAVLARYLGFESRVVVGALLSTADSAPSVAPCQDGVCTGANMTAWVEVLASSGDWIALDATPQHAVVPIDITEGEQLPQNPTVPAQASTDVLDPPPAQRDDSEASALDETAGPDWLAGLLPVLAAVGTGALSLFLLLLPLLFLLAVKSARRRRRRDQPVPEVSMVGAWEELLDSYADHRIDLPAGSTRVLVARAIGRDQAAALAAEVDAAVFAEHPPRREASDAAWAIVDAERHRLADESTPFGRITARVSLASFLRHVGPRSAVTAGLALFTPKESAR